MSWASLIASLSVYVCSHSSVHLCTLSQHAAHVVCVLVKCIMFYMCCECICMVIVKVSLCKDVFLLF